MANVLKQELVYGETKARTRSREYQWKIGNIFNKANSNNKGQSLMHKTENLLDIIYDNFDFPLFVSRGFRQFQKRKLVFYHVITYRKADKIIEWRSRQLIHGLTHFCHLEACDSVSVVSYVVDIIWKNFLALIHLNPILDGEGANLPPPPKLVF